MTSPLAPIEADGKTLLVQGVTAVKALVDALLGDVSAAIPQVEGDVLTAATTFLEAKLPGNLAGIFTMILTTGETIAAPSIAAFEVKEQLALQIVQTEADAFLEKYGATPPPPPPYSKPY
jgi:hypothetical protein